MSKIDNWLRPGAIVPVNVETTKELVDALREAMKPKAIYHGGPAFPQDKVDAWGTRTSDGGMTLRDYFAAKAMQAILDQKDAHDGRECDSAAWMAYRMADAMLKAREQ